MSNEKEFQEISDDLNEIIKKTDKKTEEETKVTILYACNSSGKTRLSKLFCDKNEGEVLYYNAFTEDLFGWDNRDDEIYTLKFQAGRKIFQVIKEDEELLDKVEKNFRKFTGLSIFPNFDFVNGNITFTYKPTIKNKNEEENSIENIKISRGEESVFIWSIFYTILKRAIEELNTGRESNSLNKFDDLKYIVIDDPVSSIDDSRIITIALELADLISESTSELKFLITTHHSLFFNVMFTSTENMKQRKYLILAKSGKKYTLEHQGDNSPFAYHHLIISEIKRAIERGELEKYHFNQFRTLLEKTANFVGCSGGWKKLLTEFEKRKTFIKTLHHFSHDRLSDLDSKKLNDDEKKQFGMVFNSFMQDFRWYLKNKPDSSFSSSIPYKFIVPGYTHQSNNLNLGKGEEILKALIECCEQTIQSSHFDQSPVSVEEDKIVLLKVRLFDATFEDMNDDRGIVMNFKVPFMKYLGKTSRGSSIDRLYFYDLMLDKDEFLEIVNMAVKHYESRPEIEYRIKESGVPSDKRQYDSSNLFAGKLQYDEKKIWF